MCNWSPKRREAHTEKNVWRNNGLCFSKFCENYTLRNSRHSVKHKKDKKTHKLYQICQNQIVGNQLLGDHLKCKTKHKMNTTHSIRKSKMRLTTGFFSEPCKPGDDAVTSLEHRREGRKVGLELHIQ